jgi:hypothetical protein
MIVPRNDFSAGNLDEDYDKKPAAKSIGGAFSPKREALLILSRFFTQQATLTYPSIFSNTTDQRSFFPPSDKDNDDFIPDEGYNDDDLFQDDKEDDLEDLSFYCTTRRSVGRKLNIEGPEQPDVTFMLEVEAKMALKEWMIKRKAYNDSVAYAHRKSLRQETSSEDLDLEEHSGVLYPQLCKMTEVKSSPLLVDHTFPLKELLLLRIAKEANFSGCQVAANSSDGKRVQVIGCAGSSFCVRAVFSLSVG